MTTLHVTVKYAGTRPTQAHPGDAGLDLRANEPMNIPVGTRRKIRTGTHIELPAGYMAEIAPRSGLATKHGLTVTNSPGIIDAGYRGEIIVSLTNHGDKPFFINKGDRIAQMLIRQTPIIHLVETSTIDTNTARGTNGFGSTGTN